MRQIDKDPRVEPFEEKVDPLVLERVVAVFCHSLCATVEVLEPLWVGFVLVVFEHFVAGDVGRISGDVQFFLTESKNRKKNKIKM